jgi:hypothetical protein
MNKFQAQTPQILFRGKCPRPSMLQLFGFLVVLVSLFGFYPNSVNAQKEIKGSWTAEYDRAKPGEIYFMFQRRTGGDGFNMTSDNLPLSELQGLTADMISATKTNVSFNIVREAGTFACEGFFSSGKGTGFWTLNPSEKFISAMRSRGYDNLTTDDLARAAFNNLTIGFIENLKTAGYDRLTFNEVMRARNHDINSEYVREVKAMGFERQPLETLIRMRNHDITAAFINEMKSAGFENLTIENLIRLQNHEITASFINDLKAEGYSDISAETAIRLKNHNIDRDFIRRAKAQGYTNASPEELIRLSNRGIVK